MGRFINPFTDVGFKIVFGQEISKPLLLHFLNTLLEGVEEIVDLSFSDKEQVSDYDDDRTLIYDVLCTTSDGRKIIVEMQNKKQGFFKKRSIYYVARAISRQGESGKKWRYDIKAVYFVAFMNFTLPDISEFRTDVVLMDYKNKSVFSDDIKMTFLQLPLFTKEEAECETIFEKWIYIFKNMNILERMPWAAQNAVFNKLSDIVEVAHLSGKKRDEYEASLKRYRDSLDIFETAKEDGLEEGIAQGVRQNSIDTAKRMKADGLPLDVIAKYTQLPLSEIEKL